MRVLIIGCGDVGLRITRAQARGTRIIGSARGLAQQQLIRQAGRRALAADFDTPTGRARIAGLANRIIYLLPPDNTLPDERRLAALLAQLGRRTTAATTHLAYCGTTGVYGNASGRVLTETTPINPQSARAGRRADAEQRLRRAAAQRRSATLKICRLRAPGIYAADRLPIARLQKGLPVLQRTDDSYSSHIHADDLAQSLWTAMLRGANGRVYNACDGQQLLMGEYFDAIADHLGLPRPPQLPAATVQAQVSPMQWSFMRESRRLSNQRLREELRVTLRYPTLAATLATLPTESGQRGDSG